MSRTQRPRSFPRRIWLSAIAGLLIVSGYFAVGVIPRAAAHETGTASGDSARAAASAPASASSPTTAAAPSGAAHAPTPPPVTGELQAAANAAVAAVAAATTQGWARGIAVVNTHTGAAITAGSATAMLPTESTMKISLPLICYIPAS